MEDTEKMSVSKFAANLIAKEEANIATAQAELGLVKQVLAAMPAHSPDPIHVFKSGYCSQVSIFFKGVGVARALLDIYPPIECVDVSGNSQSQKPLKYVRDEDLSSAIVPIFPVVFKYSGKEAHARWWTTLNGLDVLIDVEGSDPVEFKDELDSGKYYPNAHSYSSGSVSYFPRELAEPVVRPGTEEDFETVVSWFSAFFPRFSHLYENDYASKKRIIHQLRKDTGLDVSIRIMRQHGRKVSVSCWFPGLEVYPDYTFDLSNDPRAPRVKPQDLDVQYL